MPSGWQTLRGIRGLCNRSRYPQSWNPMPVIGEEAAIDEVANKGGTTRTGQIRQWD